MNLRSLVPGVLFMALGACTTTGEIIIDEHAVDMAKYRQDLQQCRSYAAQVKTGTKAARGAATGAAVGGILGAVVGNSDSAARGAGTGAVAGGVKGADRGEREAVRVTKTCLRGRGYRVLN